MWRFFASRARGMGKPVTLGCHWALPRARRVGFVKASCLPRSAWGGPRLCALGAPVAQGSYLARQRDRRMNGHTTRPAPGGETPALTTNGARWRQFPSMRVRARQKTNMFNVGAVCPYVRHFATPFARPKGAQLGRLRQKSWHPFLLAARKAPTPEAVSSRILFVFLIDIEGKCRHILHSATAGRGGWGKGPSSHVGGLAGRRTLARRLG